MRLKMLPKDRRIPRKSFGDLMRFGQRSGSKNFSLSTVNSDKARLAVSVSKKVAKRAVVRNTVRRRVYSATRNLISRLPNKLFLIIAKPGADKIRGEALRAELAGLLLKR